jgi:hypothetical protein
LSASMSLKTNDFSPLSRLCGRLTASCRQTTVRLKVSFYCNISSRDQDVSVQGLDRACDCGTII